MDESRLQVECPHCGAVFNVPDGPAGRQETCPVCRGAVRVLDVQEDAPEAPPAPAEPEVPDAEAPREDYFVQRPVGEPITEESGYCLVCCAGEEKVNPLALRPLLRSFCGLAPLEAARQVTHGMGILAERLAADTALGMVEALKSKGVEAFAVPVEKAPEPVEQVRYTMVYDADAEALHVQMDVQGTLRALGWESVVAGVCTKERFGGHRTVDYERSSTSTFMNAYTGASRTGLGLRVHVDEQPAPLILTLVLRDHQGRLHTMPVTPLHVRYAYLGERLLSNHDANFLQFLKDVAGWAQGAFFPPSYMQVAAGHPLALKEPVGRSEYNNYLRWAVCCAVARGRLPGRGEG
jgi:hypothetical protein